jgi:FeS assembly ATPase SufC
MDPHAGLFLGFQYPVEIPGVSNVQFLREALNAQRKHRGEEPLSGGEFLKLARAQADAMGMDMEMLKRPVNVGFSGGEKKRNEMVQMGILDPALAILDETDSGLDIDALRVVGEGINRIMRRPDKAVLLITHYQRLLDYVQPDFVHVLADGRITRSGGPELALELEREGYQGTGRVTALPTRRDEEWRYAPAEVLAGLKALPEAQHIMVAAGAKRIRCTNAFRRGSGKVDIQRYQIDIAEGARCEAFFLLTGGGYKRLDIDVTLAEGAHFELGAVGIGRGEEVTEIVTRLRHVAPGATSNQVMRGVAMDKATITMIGRIDVAKDAQKTDAALGAKGLLLDRTATINAKPELEIYADDVKCAHGCAIGQLDEMALFYAQQRGLPMAEARNLLMQAFVAEAYGEIADSKWRDHMVGYAEAALRGSF